MVRLFSAIGVNVFYALRTARFWISAGLYFLMLFCMSRYLVHTNDCIALIIGDTLMFDSDSFLLVICAIPSAVLFSEDWRSGRFVYIYQRTGKFNYAASTILSTFAISALVAVIGLSIFTVILSFNNSFTIPADNEGGYIYLMLMKTGGELLVKGNVLGYYALAFMVNACYMGTFSAFAALVSVWVTNPYIAMVTPLVILELVWIIAGIIPLPVFIMPKFAFSQTNAPYTQFGDPTGAGMNLFSTLYPFIYSAVCLVIIIVTAYFLIERKYARSSDVN